MLIPLAALFAAIDRRGPLAPRSVALEAAAGLVVATPIRASAPVPARARARRAGFAVASLDLIGATPETPAELAKRPTAVLAGETLAEGADATLDPAWAYDETPFAAIAAPAPGAGARLAGQDLPAGALLARPGDSLTPARLLTLAAAGVQTVEVAAPAFRIGGPAQPTRLFLAATLRDLGCRPASAGEAPDLDIRFDGGLSPRLAMEPGAELALAFDGGRARLALSPTPEAGAGALAILLPLIGRWTHRAPARESAPLTRKLTSTIGLSDLALLAREPEGWRPLAVGDAPLAALLAADGLAALDPGCEGMAAGATLAAIPLAAPLAPLPLAGAAQSAI